MRIFLAPLVVSTLWCCAEPYAGGRLRPNAVPEIVDPKGSQGRLPDPAVEIAPPVEIPSLQGVATANLSEEEVLGHVERLHAQHGDAGLRALLPGTTLKDRLRFCTAQIQLGRSREILPELRRLADDHGEAPLVWRQLGYALYWADQRDDADRCMRRAYALAGADEFATCPSLPSFLGKLLLERPKTRQEGVRILRTELADGEDHIRAAWALATYLCRQERHADALDCLDVAIKREPLDAQLQVGKAKVLLELHRTKAAMDLLEPLVKTASPDRFAIESMMRARILRNEFAAALPLIDRLIALPGLAAADRVRMQARRESVAAAVKTGFRKLVPAYKVEAIVRGHPNLQFRVKVLREVMQQESTRLRSDCLTIAFNSEAAVLRAEALIALMPQTKTPLVDLKAGLGDRDGIVRGTAAVLTGGLKANRDQATALLIEYMGKETETYPFGRMHAALVQLTGREFELPFGAAKDPKLRLEITARWRKGQ